MIKLKDLITEFYMDSIFGSDTTHWTVVKPFKFQTRKGWKASGMHYGSSKIYKGDYEWVVAPKGAQVSNIPGGLFVIVDKKILVYGKIGNLLRICRGLDNENI